MTKGFVGLILGVLLGFLTSILVPASAVEPPTSQNPKATRTPAEMVVSAEQAKRTAQMMAEARLEKIEEELATVARHLTLDEQELAQHESKLEHLEEFAIKLDRHTHKYVAPYISGWMNLPTMKMHMDNTGFLVPFQNSANISANAGSFSTEKPQD